MQAEQADLEQKNHELADALRLKANSLAATTKAYQSLKAQVMATTMADAASQEAEHGMMPSRRDRIIDRVPGVRMGNAANFGPVSGSQQTAGGRVHMRDNSRSSGGGQQQGGVNLGPSLTNHLRARMNTGREYNFFKRLS